MAQFSSSLYICVTVVQVGICRISINSRVWIRTSSVPTVTGVQARFDGELLHSHN